MSRPQDQRDDFSSRFTHRGVAGQKNPETALAWRFYAASGGKTPGLIRNLDHHDCVEYFSRFPGLAA